MNRRAQQTQMVQESAWNEWKAACTIAKCTAETRAQIARFGRYRLQKPLMWFSADLASEYCKDSNVAEGKKANAGMSERAWLCMEAHLYAGRNPALQKHDGKRYKDLAFASAKTSSELEGYLSFAFRSLASRIAFEEGGGARNANGAFSKRVVIASLDAPHGASERPLVETLSDDSQKHADADSKPEDADFPQPFSVNDEGEVIDPEDSVLNAEVTICVEPEADRDAERVDEASECLAKNLWADLSDRDRLMLVFYLHGLSRADMQRSGLFSCQQSQLYAHADRLMDKIRTLDWGETVNERERAFRTRLLIRRMTAFAEEWINSLENKDRIHSIINGADGLHQEV